MALSPSMLVLNGQVNPFGDGGFEPSPASWLLSSALQTLTACFLFMFEKSHQGCCGSKGELESDLPSGVIVCHRAGLNPHGLYLQKGSLSP